MDFFSLFEFAFDIILACLVGCWFCISVLKVRYWCAVTTSNEKFDILVIWFVLRVDVRLNAAKTALLPRMLLWSVGCLLCENSEAQWELCFFPRFSFHGASLRYFHLFWERRSIIRNATETTQAHTRTLIPLHLSHQIVQGRKNFCDKARPNPRGNHIVQLDEVIW